MREGGSGGGVREKSGSEEKSSSAGENIDQ